MESHGVPCGPVLSVAETVNHPHFVERGTVRTINDPIHGEVQIPGMPVKTSGYPAESDAAAPTLGQHNSEVLRDLLGKSEADVQALCNANILHEGPT